MKSILNVKISIKLVVFSVVSSLIALCAVGLHFYYFLEKDSLEKTKKNIEFFFHRFEEDINTQKIALENQTKILDNDEALSASIYLINNYESFEKADSYNAILLDEEKKILVSKLLEQAKFGSVYRMLLYNKEQKLISGVEKRSNTYKLFFNSYYSGVAGYYIASENEDFIFGDLSSFKNISVKHMDTYIDLKNSPPQITYLTQNNFLMLNVHHSLFNDDSNLPIAHIEVSKVFDDIFLNKYTFDQESKIFWSHDYKYDAIAVSYKNLSKVKVLEIGENYVSALKYPTLNGPLYLVYTQNKKAITSLLQKSVNEFFFVIFIVLFILLSSMFFVYHYVLINPLKTLMSNINHIKERAFGKISKIHTEDELEEIAKNIEDLAHNVRDKEEQLQYQVEHDTLTGLHDRYYFNLSLKQAIENIQTDDFISVLFIDIDQFKLINDTLGHNVGDLLLVEVSSRLNKHFSQYGSICRIGGDEFILIVDNPKNKKNIEEIAKAIKELFVEHFIIEDNYIKTSVSLGITFSYSCEDNPQSILKEADIALYKSKERGRNRYTFYEEEFSLELIERSKIIYHLKNAIQDFSEFILVYQPKISLENHQIQGVEALIRWNNPELGFVSPDNFISIAEESGIIVELGYWILEKACMDFMLLKRYGYKLQQMSVNVSAIQMQSENFINQLEDIVQKTNINPQELELEITERYIAHNNEESDKVMNQIRSLGIDLAIDDFGTGYSSLSYLKRLPVTRLKVDKSFIDDCEESAEMLSVVKAIIGLAQTFNLQSTAEGVENEQQLEVLQNLKCDEVQGYFFAKPMNLEDLKEFLDKSQIFLF